MFGAYAKGAIFRGDPSCAEAWRTPTLLCLDPERLLNSVTVPCAAHLSDILSCGLGSALGAVFEDAHDL